MAKFIDVTLEVKDSQGVLTNRPGSLNLDAINYMYEYALGQRTITVVHTNGAEPVNARISMKDILNEMNAPNK